ncbi:MAG: galactose mutarotase [Erysipelotrichales bacterium]|nr:galactose mutarotase [Erysipelotrichales bacterium]
MNYLGFGTLKDGTKTHIFKLENEKYRVDMSDYGATVVNFIDKKTGIDILLGYTSIWAYTASTPYMGATVGRVCNRIMHGKFTLNGKEYQLPLNDRGNTLHGGLVSYAKKVWDVKREGKNTLVFTYHSNDGEEGFPGDLDLTAIYTLEEDGLRFTWKAYAKEDTICSLTNHAYFNLHGPSDTKILDHTLKINADTYNLLNNTGVALEENVPVEGTPFDFRTPKPIGQDIRANDPQIHIAGGYDHNFVINGKGMREACVLATDKLRLTVETDLEGVQLYTGNKLPGNVVGKDGHFYPPYSGVCLETQHVPNAINYEKFEKPLVHAGETVEHTTFYRLEEL